MNEEPRKQPRQERAAIVPLAADWRQAGAVLLVSCYELGRQPQALALPMAFLERAGFAPAAVDVAVESLDPAAIARARFLGISVPMHTALRIGMQVARRVRAVNRECFICFYGHYAVLHGESLLEGLADAVLGGEMEAELVALVERVEKGEQGNAGIPQARTHAAPVDAARTTAAAPFFDKLDFPIPSRTRLPALQRYAHLQFRDQHVIAGQVEASRGCLHRCRHCPIPAVYDGRIFIVPVETVLADVRNQVASGARHITFADADFLNGPAHALRVARAMHTEFPQVTFDFTAKVEHVLRQCEVVRQLGELGAIFMVSAVESLNDRVLQILAKDHTRADVYEALCILREAGIAMRASFLPFTPWSSRSDVLDLLEFAVAEDLVEAIDPVQYTIRLLVPPGSLLLQHPELQPFLHGFDAEALTHVWFHPDPEMDRLQKDLAALVEQATAEAEDARTTFDRILQRVDPKHASRAAAAVTAAETRPHQRPPRITEPWFC